METDEGLTTQQFPRPETEAFCYAVVDLAAVADLRPLITGLTRSVAAPLFSRTMPHALLEAGPWLVRLSKARELEDALKNTAADVPWGYYLFSDVDIASLRHSLRRFNVVEIPDASKPVLFRYWDPRVMRVFLQVATRKQRASLFDLIWSIKSADGSFSAVKNVGTGNVDVNVQPVLSTMNYQEQTL